MSTPMFIREPVAGQWASGATGGHATAVTGQSLATFAAIAESFILPSPGVSEPTLVEEIAWCTGEFSTDAGMLLLFAVDDGGEAHAVGAYALDAGTATLYANGRISVNLTLPTGWTLAAAHNVQSSGASGYVDVYMLPLGGIVR